MNKGLKLSDLAAAIDYRTETELSIDALMNKGLKLFLHYPLHAFTVQLSIDALMNKGLKPN